MKTIKIVCDDVRGKTCRVYNSDGHLIHGIFRVEFSAHVNGVSKAVLHCHVETIEATVAESKTILVVHHEEEQRSEESVEGNSK